MSHIFNMVSLFLTSSTLETNLAQVIEHGFRVLRSSILYLVVKHG